MLNFFKKKNEEAMSQSTNAQSEAKISYKALADDILAENFLYNREGLTSNVKHYLQQAQYGQDAEERQYGFCQAGVEYKRMGNLKDAIRCYQNAIKIIPYMINVYSMGKSLFLSGLYEEALTCYELVFILAMSPMSDIDLSRHYGITLMAKAAEREGRLNEWLNDPFVNQYRIQLYGYKTNILSENEYLNYQKWIENVVIPSGTSAGYRIMGIGNANDNSKKIIADVYLKRLLEI